MLLLSPDRGAVAVWAPSGLSMNDQARHLGEGFYGARFGDGERVIGEAILRTQDRYLDQDGELHLIDIYNLIGDPATVMK